MSTDTFTYTLTWANLTGPATMAHIHYGAVGVSGPIVLPFFMPTSPVGYWEDPDWRIDFTTMDDTAAFTAAAALDPGTPKALHIASFQVSLEELVVFTPKTFGTPYQLVRLGRLEELRAHDKRERAAHPQGENKLYASWQQSQYMQSMFSKHHESLDTRDTLGSHGRRSRRLSTSVKSWSSTQEERPHSHQEKQIAEHGVNDGVHTATA